MIQKQNVKSYLLISNFSAKANELGYTTMSAVEKKGYTTMSAVEAKGYTTMSAVEAKGYINESVSQGIVNGLWDALTTGTTTIYKGVISTTFIDVDTITTNMIASKVSISNWTIADGAYIGGFLINEKAFNTTIQLDSQVSPIVGFKIWSSLGS